MARQGKTRQGKANKLTNETRQNKTRQDKANELTNETSGLN